MQKGQIRRAAADAFEKVQQAQQGSVGISGLSCRLDKLRYHRIETLMGATAQLAVFVAVAQLLQTVGYRLRIGKAERSQLSLTLAFVQRLRPNTGQFVAFFFVLFFRLGKNLVEQGIYQFAVLLKPV